MRADDLRALIPTSKVDFQRVDAVVALGYPAVAPIIPELLEWLKDMNWPIAHVLAAFLATIGLPLVPEIRRILRTNDHIWQYWVLSSLARTPGMASALREELTRLADHPTREEADEELHVLAREILDEHG